MQIQRSSGQTWERIAFHSCFQYRRCRRRVDICFGGAGKVRISDLFQTTRELLVDPTSVVYFGNRTS